MKFFYVIEVDHIHSVDFPSETAGRKWADSVPFEPVLL